MEEYENIPLIDNTPSSPTIKMTVSEIINSYGMGRFQWILLFIIGLNGAADAAETMLISFLMPVLKEFWDLSSYQEAMIGSIVFIGMLIGSTIFGILSDYFGRKKTGFVTILIVIAGALLSVIAPNIQWMIFFRGLVGLGVGGNHVVFSLLSEYLPSTTRSSVLIIYQAFWSVGIILESGIAYLVLQNRGWRPFLVVSAIPIVLFGIFFIFVPESPHYLSSIKDKPRLIKCFNLISKINRKKLPPFEIVFEEEDLEKNSVEIEKNNQNDFVVYYENKSFCERMKTFKLFRLFGREVRYITILSLLLWFICVFCYYGIALLTPIFFAEKNGGVYFNTLLTACAEFPSVLLTALAIKYINEKKFLVFQFLMSFVFTFLLGFKLKEIFLLMLALLSRGFISAAFSNAFVMTVYFFPTELRTTGLGLDYAVGRVGGVVTSFVVTVLSPISFWYPILFFSGSCLLAALVTVLLPFKGGDLK